MSATTPPAEVAAGHYAKKQLLSKARLIAWSHGSRFRVGLGLARRFAGTRVLDYGCGDGTLLALVMSEPARPASAVGCEIHPRLVDDCRSRLGHLAGLSFVAVNELDRPEHEGAYDAVFCMEVLEHVFDREPLLERFDRLLAPSGLLIVSVPVETGPALLVKQCARRVAGWRGIGDYPGQSPYTCRELCASLFAGRRQHITRPVHRGADGEPFHDHKGFNWRVLSEELKRRFVLEQTFGSPMRWLPVSLSSQVWFVLRKRSSVAGNESIR
jgi:SAM-dependent methyltransferase